MLATQLEVYEEKHHPMDPPDPIEAIRFRMEQQGLTRDASIEDQFRICRDQAKREGWQVVGCYKEAAISGSSMILRQGIQTILQDAQAGQFDMALAEALDRVSRDQADVATLYKHLQFARVPIFTLAEGEISELHVCLKGTMNALFLNELAAKTHHGLRGRVEDGKSGGASSATSPPASARAPSPAT
ncbi:recombinase family protein [Aliihoeflea sp. PC F10.4]